MIIQHNIPAMNSYRNLNNNQNAIAGNLEKLSSGYQINRAGDNAAGLAISEKMRSQITGLDAAQTNVADGISLVKTAEGALQEVHDMLNRMTELATLSANGTFDDEVDRAALQSEVEALTSEIDRIKDSTNFNGINLLDGSLAGGVEVEATLISNGKTMGTTTNYYDLSNVADGSTIMVTDSDGVEKGLTLTHNSDSSITLKDATGSDVTTDYVKDASSKYDVKLNTNYSTSAGKLNYTQFTNAAFTEGDSLSIGDKTYTIEFVGTDISSADYLDGDTIYMTAGLSTEALDLKRQDNTLTGVSATSSGADLDLGELTIDGVYQVTGSLAAFTIIQDPSATGGLTLQIGDTSDHFNQIRVSVDNMGATSLGVADIDIGDQSGAVAAIDKIKAAINKVSTNRAGLGATQNRLEHTSANLAVAEENIQDAESTIRDTDVAAEMMEYTKNNILIQSAQSMLAQANQLPQGVLQLLG